MNTVMSITERVRTHWLPIVLTFAAFLIVAQVSTYLYRDVSASSSVILSPAGVGFAATVIAGYIVLPAIALAALANGIINGAPLAFIFGSVIGNTFQAFILFAILKKIGFDRRLSTVKDMIALVGMALVGSMIVPTVNLITRQFYSFLMDAPYPAPWLTWWLGGAISMLVIAPLLIRWVGRPYSSRSRATLIEISIAIILLTINSIFLFGSSVTSIYGMSLILPLTGILFWLAFRAGPRFMTLALFIMTVISFGGALYGTYTPSAGGLAERIYNTQVFDLFIAFFFFILVSLEEQRKEAVRRLSEQNKMLRGTVHSANTETRAKNEFIATLAHELRNPLAPLLSSVEMLKLTASPQSDTAKTLSQMHNQIRTMGYLLDDLLDISRISQRRLTLNKTKSSLETIVRRAVEMTTPSIADRKHLLTVTLPQQSLDVEVDALRIEQVIVNLLHNASKYTPEGGRIDLIVEHARGELILKVRDTGIGIPEEMLNRIFEPFVQVNSLGKKSGGIGIGLALTKNLVEMHNGMIDVRRGPNGVGTEFEVRIPTTAETRFTPSTEEPIRRTAKNQGLSILVVDDNESAADTLQKLLTLRGHKVQVAYDGEEALAALSHAAPDVVILDIGLPDIDGYEIAGRIREAHINTVLVAITGYGQDEDKKRSEESGFDFHLVKPVGLDNLEPVLASVGAKSMRTH